MSRHLMLVAGSGRSGTSLFVNIVASLGFHVPKPWIVTDDSNPRGFGEPQWVVDWHNELLRMANVQASDARPSAWADTAKLCLDDRISHQLRRWLENQFSIREQLVIKDPRLMWFLPLWRRIGEELGAGVSVVTMLRHPAEVVKSKLTWYPGMQLVDANRAAGWVNTMLFTERATRDCRRSFVRFDDLLEDWTQQVARVSEDLEIPSLVNARAQQQMTADSMVDRSLRRSIAGWADLDVPKDLVRMAEQVWESLLDLTKADDTERKAIMAKLDGCREEYISYYHYAEAVAQSTTLAAERPLRRRLRRLIEQTATSQEKPLPSSEKQPKVPLLKLARRVIPASVRGRIPRRFKLALAKLLLKTPR